MSVPSVTSGIHRLSSPPATRRGRRSLRERQSPKLVGALLATGLGAAVALPVKNALGTSLTHPGALATVAGDVTAMAGTYLLLVMVLLAGRIGALESALGQDTLIRLHRRLSSAPLVLLGAHGVLTTLGFAESSRVGFFAEAGSLITTMAWIFAAVVAYGMFVAIAMVSIRGVRRRFRYDTWWVIHLYTYLALAFSLLHQIVDGTDFVGHPVAQAGWLMLWAMTAGVVVVYRIGLPILRTVVHRLEVVHVRTEAPGVYSLLIRGRRLDKLAVSGGQYFGWRFLTRDLWWHAHPFSISAMPSRDYIRVTIKAVGDTTARIAALRPGTRIAVEGPYGAFTEAARTRHKVALIGAGVGITPLVALLGDLPRQVDAVVVQRASNVSQLIHNRELRDMLSSRNGRLVELVGSRAVQRLDEPQRLGEIVPDLRDRDIYVCGPERFTEGVVAAAQALGVPHQSIHRESFEF